MALRQAAVQTRRWSRTEAVPGLRASLPQHRTRHVAQQRQVHRYSRTASVPAPPLTRLTKQQVAEWWRRGARHCSQSLSWLLHLAGRQQRTPQAIEAQLQRTLTQLHRRQVQRVRLRWQLLLGQSLLLPLLLLLLGVLALLAMQVQLQWL